MIFEHAAVSCKGETLSRSQDGEIKDEVMRYQNHEGSLSMYSRGGPHTSGSIVSINAHIIAELAPTRPGTVFGIVNKGLLVIQKINQVFTSGNVPKEAIVIYQITIK